MKKTVVPGTGTVGSTRTVTVRVLNLDSVTVENLNFTDPNASQSYQGTLTLSPNREQTLRLTSFSGGDARTMAYSATPTSSGTYVLAPSVAEFLWTARNGTRIRYSISTGEIVFASTSGPLTQFSTTLNDLWPYSLLLAVFFVLTPILEIGRRFRSARLKRRKDSGVTY